VADISSDLSGLPACTKPVSLPVGRRRPSL
jgi:hypothetical protein